MVIWDEARLSAGGVRDSDYGCTETRHRMFSVFEKVLALEWFGTDPSQAVGSGGIPAVICRLIWRRTLELRSVLKHFFFLVKRLVRGWFGTKPACKSQRCPDLIWNAARHSSPCRVVVQRLIEHGQEEIGVAFSDTHRRLDPERLRCSGGKKK